MGVVEVDLRGDETLLGLHSEGCSNDGFDIGFCFLLFFVEAFQ